MNHHDAFYYQTAIVSIMILNGANELPAWEGEQKQKLEPSLKESGLGLPNDDTFIDRFRKVTPRNLACAGLDILMPEILRRKSGTRRALSSTAWLDGLRGWAALIVCMVHLTVYTHQVRTTYFPLLYGSCAGSQSPRGAGCLIETIQPFRCFGQYQLTSPFRTLSYATTTHCSESHNSTKHQQLFPSSEFSSQAAISPSWSSSSSQAT